jgi:arylsulfatase A-like enzyme
MAHDFKSLGRRGFLGALGAAISGCMGMRTATEQQGKERGVSSKPNVVFVFGDQWRAQATGYGGDPNAITPHIDELSQESINFTHAVAGMPVCTPYRASFITGQYWLTHGVFVNDVCLSNDATSIAEAFKAGGYDTAYVGKWHLDGHGRSNFIPRERRQGFDYWKVLECTHNYNESYYYADDQVKRQWPGYDAVAQTRDAQEYIRGHDQDRPFFLVLSWGPPHNPYETAPEEYRAMHPADDVQLRPNVPADQEKEARKDLAGYNAHCTVLDACVGDLRATLKERGLEEDTIFVFTSDHGDMLHSQGHERKQKPWEESLRVPFLLRYPAKLGETGREVETLINTPDIMPTLLGLAGVPVPESVEGIDYAPALLRGESPQVEGTLFMCPWPFGEWTRERGGRECRGVRTTRYTYVRDLKGPWLLYDNDRDPHQLTNLCNAPGSTAIQAKLDALLDRLLAERNDEFLPGEAYIEKWGYPVGKNGTVPYIN